MSSHIVALFLAWALLASCQGDEVVCQNGEVGTNVRDAHSLLSIKSAARNSVIVSEGVSLEALRQRSLSIAHEFAVAAKAMPASSTTKALFESFQICGQCKTFQRFGEANDGGYLMCMDGLKKGSVNAAYSLGVEHHDKWSEDVIKHFGIPVNQFDCTVSASDCKGCNFHKKCIISADGNHPVAGHESEGWSLSQCLAETGQADAADGSLLMKMDIESSEWAIYASEPPAALKKFGELLVEFHELQDESRHAEYLQAMQHIEAAGFKVAHLHGNNYGSMYQSGDKSMPEVLEVTFVHGPARAGGCANEQLPQNLDAANNPSAPELPVARLASSLLSIKSRTRSATRATVDHLQQRSLSLARQFAHSAKAMPVSDTSRALFDSFRICGQCNTFQRFGEPNDGGYLMCMDGLKKGSVKAAYSLGVEHHDQWSEDVIKHLGIAVNQFDCTVSASECKGCKFFKKCIVSADGSHPVPGHESEGWSLTQCLAETGQAAAADNSLLMKMDIESSEWPIYSSEPPAALKKFGELIVEFHGLEQESRHAEYLQAMQHILAAGFKVAHLHGNNYDGMYEAGASSIPRVLEVTFVHAAARPNGCAADQLYETLDTANNPSAPELPMSKLTQ